jgi:hypothetical protein
MKQVAQVLHARRPCMKNLRLGRHQARELAQPPPAAPLPLTARRRRWSSVNRSRQLSGDGADGDPLTIGGAFAVQLMWINISLGAFNLLPAFPMNGGRILRAALGFRMDRNRATAVAARVGRRIAVLMGLAGVMWSPMLAVIALFV